ncbi:MAG: hypothetical protein R6W76_13075 [Caldilinea sp.]
MSEMIVQGRPFTDVGRFVYKRQAGGGIATYKPQDRYLKAKSTPLHRYGAGEFCSFNVPGAPLTAGVYLMRIGDDIMYVGEAQCLRDRMDACGHISPKNCYVDGRQTNCRINKLILDAARRAELVHVRFHECDDRKRVESDLIAALSPRWNR